MSKSATVQKVFPCVIVGLGNPEPKYEKTRHNIGFEVVDAIAQAWQLTWQKNRRCQGWIAEGRGPHGDKICLLKPSTYMNQSGQSLRAVMDWYKLRPEDCFIIYDDMDLPMGRIRLRLSGSAGGHNGVKSIIAHLGSQNFPRLRIGIGKSREKQATISYVLGRFAGADAMMVAELLTIAVEIAEVCLKDGFETAMNRYNSLVLGEETSSP